jgi:hypothetical protein
MVRAMAFLLSFWCIALFVVGQGAHVPQSVVWPTGLVGLLSLLFSMLAPDMRPRARHVITFLIGGAITGLGILAWALRSPPWLPFCILSGAGCYLGVVIAELIWSPRDRGTMAPYDADPHRVYMRGVTPGTAPYRDARDEEELDRGGSVRPLA